MFEDLTSTFTDTAASVNNFLAATAGPRDQIQNLLNQVKLGGSGPAPSPTAAKPGADASTFTAGGIGVLDKAADAIGINRSGLKWGLAGLGLLLVVGIGWKLMRRGK